MANTYRQVGPFGATYNYVDYSITPDLGQAIAVGDTVTIQGKLFDSDIAARELRLVAIEPGYEFYESERRHEVHSASVNLPKGKPWDFSMSFQFPFVSSLWPDGGRKTSDVHFYFEWGDGTYGTLTGPEEDQKLTLLRYRLAPQILALDFERATPEGKWADDGQYLQCKALKLAIDPRAVVDDITKATVVCAGSDGSSRSVNLTREQIEAALTTDGYSETAPGIFADFVSALGVDYTLTLTLGDDYDQTFRTDAVVRSFARLHFSGAKRGGVAVGMFSTATDDVPKFEVADNHESHFYSEAQVGTDGKLRGGTEIVGVNSYQRGEHLTGGRWVDGRPIYRQVFAGYKPVDADYIISSDFGYDRFDTLISCTGTWGRRDWIYSGLNWFFNPQNTSYVSWVQINAPNICLVGKTHGYYVVIVEYTKPGDSESGRIVRPAKPMTANESNNCIASASTFYNNSYAPFLAFDNNTGTLWASGVGTETQEEWIQLQMDVALKNIEVTVTPRVGTTQHPLEGKLLASNDGSSWTELGTYQHADITSLSAGTPFTISSSNATSYSYVRLTCTKRSTPGTSLVIPEITITGDFDRYVDPHVSSTPALPEGPEMFDMQYVDAGVARADYIAMMSGIEIPDDTEPTATTGAQSDPNGMESPGIDGEIAPSAHYDTVARYYRCDCWSAAMVKNAVGRWITADEAEQIINGTTAD